MSEEKETHLTEAPDDEKATVQKKTAIEQVLHRTGENAKHVYRIALVIAAIGYVGHNYIFPNWEWFLPGLIAFAGVATFVINLTKHRILASATAFVTLLSVAGISQYFLWKYIGAYVAAILKTPTDPAADQILHLSYAWAIVVNEFATLAYYAYLERTRYLEEAIIALDQATTANLNNMAAHFTHFYRRIEAVERTNLTGNVKDAPA